LYFERDKIVHFKNRLWPKNLLRNCCCNYYWNIIENMRLVKKTRWLCHCFYRLICPGSDRRRKRQCFYC